MKYAALVQELTDARARLEVLDVENADLRESVYPLRTEVDDLHAANRALLDEVVALPELRENLDEMLRERRDHIRDIDALRNQVEGLEVQREALHARLESDRRNRWLQLRDQTFAMLVSQNTVVRVPADPFELKPALMPMSTDAMHSRAVAAANAAYGSMGQPEQAGGQQITALDQQHQRSSAAE